MDVREFLDENGIKYKEFEHPAVYTCEEAEKYTKDIRGPHIKNLFLKEKKGRRFYLVIIPAEDKVDMENLSEFLGDKVKFAGEQDLMERLGLSTGAVSVFGLIHDKEVVLVVDKRIWEADHVSFHPNVNTSTLELKKEDFHKFVEIIGNKVVILE